LTILAYGHFQIWTTTTAPDVPDFDAIKAETERYVASVLDSTNDALEKMLPSLWGNGDPEYRNKLWETIDASGLGKAEDGRKSNISKM
jgi:hypothetical protein